MLLVTTLLYCRDSESLQLVKYIINENVLSKLKYDNYNVNNGIEIFSDIFFFDACSEEICEKNKITKFNSFQINKDNTKCFHIEIVDAANDKKLNLQLYKTIKIYQKKSNVVIKIYNGLTKKIMVCIKIPVVRGLIKLSETKYNEQNSISTNNYYPCTDSMCDTLHYLIKFTQNKYVNYIYNKHDITYKIKYIKQIYDIYRSSMYLEIILMMNDCIYFNKSWDDLNMLIKNKYNNNYDNAFQILTIIIINDYNFENLDYLINLDEFAKSIEQLWNFFDRHSLSENRCSSIIMPIIEKINNYMLRHNTSNITLYRDVIPEKTILSESIVDTIERINEYLNNILNTDQHIVMNNYEKIKNNMVKNGLIEKFNSDNINYISEYVIKNKLHNPVNIISKEYEHDELNILYDDNDINNILSNIYLNKNNDLNKIESSFMIDYNNSNNKYHYIITYGNSMISNKIVISNDGKTKKYTQEEITKDSYVYTKIGNNGGKYITITENDDKNNNYGFDGYKAGVTKNGLPCIIVLRIFPDSIIVCDDKTKKYRTNKCTVKNIYLVPMESNSETGFFKICEKFKCNINQNILLYNTTPDGICPVCCLNEASQVARPCNHNMCLDCWIKLLCNNKKEDIICPFCRSKIDKIDFMPNYVDNLDEIIIKYPEAYSIISTKKTRYTVGKVIEISDFDTNLNAVCCNGIHFHIDVNDVYKWFEYLLIPNELKNVNLNTYINEDMMQYKKSITFNTDQSENEQNNNPKKNQNDVNISESLDEVDLYDSHSDFFVYNPYNDIITYDPYNNNINTHYLHYLCDDMYDSCDDEDNM